MSIHRSLKSNTKDKHRTVRKRWERIRSLILQQKFDRGKDSVYGLPKEKIIKFKIKKEKKEEDINPLTEIVEEANKEKK